MKKEYVTARLFRNREADCLNTDEELQGCDQQPSQTPNNCAENNEAVESNETPTIVSLPERLLCVVKRVLARLLS